MKLPISELLDGCSVEDIALGTQDAAMNARVKATVMTRITRQDRPKHVRLRRTARLTLLIAAAMLLFGAVAYASGLFRMEAHEMWADSTQKNGWVIRDSAGNDIHFKLNELFDSGLSFIFESNAPLHRAEFRPGWLPEEPTPSVVTEDPGWYTYLIDDREDISKWHPEAAFIDVGIPYLITVEYASPQQILVLGGACKTVKHETWDSLEVYEIRCFKDIYVNAGFPWPTHTRSYENYVLLFSPQEGYMINIGGTLDLETLEHIARELEVRTTDDLIAPGRTTGVQVINIVRG